MSQKGGNFEREICRTLSLWFTRNKTEDAFWRTAGSGGMATTRRKKGKAKAEDFGDIKHDLDCGKPLTNFFSIELKTGYGKRTKSKAQKHQGKTVEIHNNWSIMDCIDSTQQKPQFIMFWEQAVRDADLSEREPMLIFRRNNKRTCIAVYEDIFLACVRRFEVFEKNAIRINTPYYAPIWICNLNDFFEWSGNEFTEEFIKIQLNRVLIRRKYYG